MSLNDIFEINLQCINSYSFFGKVCIHTALYNQYRPLFSYIKRRTTEAAALTSGVSRTKLKLPHSTQPISGNPSLMASFLG